MNISCKPHKATTKNIKRKEFKHTTKESHQTMKEEKKRRKKDFIKTSRIQ